METIVLVIHLILAIALIAVILMQRSEGGALGMGGGGGGGGGFMTGRAAADILTRTTAILATCFICTSILLAILAGAHESGSLLDRAPAPEATPTAPSSTPQAPAATPEPTPAPAQN
jgi:preprotein translocase subunit SecG